MKAKLKKVFFRLDSLYKWGEGMDDRLTERFNEEALAILNELEFNIVADGSRSFSCPEGVQGEQNLYMHPMSFSGILLEQNIEHTTNVILAAAIMSSIFSVRSIDIFDIEEHHLKHIESNLRKQKEFS